MVLDAFLTSFSTIPQLHEATLGLHVKSTNIDMGSHTATLVCTENERYGAIAREHPEITFIEPMQNVHVVATSTDGRVFWDANYDLGGKTVLTKTAIGTGAVPNWNKICTPLGQVEAYSIAITGTSAKSATPVTTSVSFTSDNLGGLALPARRLIERVQLPGALPWTPVTVPISTQDMDPLRYLKQKLF